MAATALLPAQLALAACAPPSGSAPHGTVVTCSGVTVNQDPPSAGYGTAALNGVTVNVQTTASVLGVGGLSSVGILLGNNNIVNNLGIVDGDDAGIQVNGPFTLTNSGSINAVINGVINTAAGTMTINNSGSITSIGLDGIVSIGSLTLLNTGSIAGDFRAIFTNSADINNSGTITGGAGPGAGPALLLAGPPSTVFNSGTITGVSGTAISFFAPAGDTLTIAPTSVINGNVLAGDGDRFQLGGTGSGTFNVSNLGPAAQYSGFTVFNKVDSSTWTLTGTGNQNWTVSGGTLIGDTNSLGGPAITDNAALVFNQNFDGTYAGAVSGTGSVTKSGAGTVIFTGNNTYTGSTIISGGVLELGNGGTSGSIVGDVANSGVLAVNRSNALTLGGVISGTGSFQQNGTGTTIFTGANTYTGGTLISGGTLQLGNGGTTGSIVGDVTNNANLVFNRSDAITFGGVISGSGAVAHNGSGNTTFTAANTYTGLTNINAGTLTVNGSLVSSVNVNSGGTLMGTGTVGGINALSGGIVAPGNSIGTLNVAGPVAFGPGSTYQVEVNAAGQSDRIVATGAATLTGGTVQVLAAPGNYAPNTVYNILHASSVTGTFAGVTSNLAFLTPSLTYDADDVFLTLVRNASAFSTVAQTFNQRAVAGALDASAFGSTLVQAILPLTAPQSPVAFDQLSGEVHASTAGVLVDESRYMRGAVLGRLRQASYSGETSMASLSLGGPQVAFADGELDSALAYGKSPIVTKAPRVAPAPGPDIAFWAQGFGARGTFDGDGNAASLKRDLAGFITGFDARFGGNWRAGIAAGYTASRNNAGGRGTANVESGHVAAYGGLSVGALNLRAGGAYAFHEIDTDRTIAFPGFFDRATARYDGGTGQIFGEAGYGFAFGSVAVEPFAGAAWVHLNTDAANERGGAAALALAANKFEVGYSTLGIRAATMIPLGHNMVLVPRASAAWQHAFNAVTPTAALAFNTGAAFVVAGVPIARDAVLAEAGLDLAIGRNATIGVSYVGQLARNVEDHAAKGKFSWRF